jgi:undecaprenyl-diphosphatase
MALRDRRLVVSLILLAVGALVMGLFLAGIDEIFEHRDLDERALLAIGSLRRYPIDRVATDITALGSVTLTVLVVTVGVSALWLARDRLDAIQLLVAALGAGAAEVIAKLSFARPRPSVIPHLVEVTGFSFPSGHTLMSTAVYATLAIMVRRRAPTREARTLATIAACVIIAAIGLSRVYLGVHNPSDVLAGLGAGLAWAITVGMVEQNVRPGRSRASGPAAQPA